MSILNHTKWPILIFALGIFALTLTPGSYFFIRIEVFLDQFISKHFLINVTSINEQLHNIGLPNLMTSKNGGLSRDYIIIPLKKFSILLLLGYSIFTLSNSLIFKDIFYKKNIRLSIWIFLGIIIFSPPFQAPYGVASMGQGFMVMSTDPFSVSHTWYQYKILIPYLANMSGMYGPSYYFFWMACLWVAILLILTPFNKEQSQKDLPNSYIFLIVFGILSTPGFSEYLFMPGYVDVLVFGILFHNINVKISNSQQNSFAAIGFLTHELSMFLFPIFAFAKKNYFPAVIALFFFVLILVKDPLAFFENRVGSGILNDALSTNTLLLLGDTLLGLISSFSVFIIFIPGFLFWCLKNHDHRNGYTFIAAFIVPIMLTAFFVDYTRIMFFSFLPVSYYVYFNSQYSRKFLMSISLIQIFTPNFHFTKGSVAVLQNGLIEWFWHNLYNLIIY